MMRIIRIVLILMLTCFSFYYTDKMILLSKMKDPLMQKIIDYKNNHNFSYENGVITQDTMLVGTSGKKININKSYEKMKRVNSFNEALLEYENVNPVIDKKSNLEKLLKGKSTNDKTISFVFNLEDLNKLEQILYILDKNNTQATFFIDGKLIEDNLDFMKNTFDNNNSIGYFGYHNDYSIISLKYIKGILKINGFSVSNYCLYRNKLFLESCISSDINTISPILIKDDLYNFIKYKKQNGYIYEIKDTNYNIKQLNSTLLYLKSKGYNLVLLDELLKE